MFKNLMILLCVAVPAIAGAVINAPLSNSFDATGTISRYDKKFIKVKADAAYSRGQIVSLDLTADDGASATLTADRGKYAMCVADEAIASGSMGKCQVYGYHDSVLFDADNGAATAGQFLYVSGTVAGSADAAVIGNGTGQNDGSFFPVAVALDAAAASASIEAFIVIQ